MSVYTSTNCLKNPKNVITVLNKYAKSGIENVELGSVHDYFDVNELKKFDFNFLIHNYFPPPKIPFNFNLASNNKEIQQKSKDLAKQAIDLCCIINSSIYTFHAGFTVDPPKLGKPLPRLNMIDRQIAIEIFSQGLNEILDFAENRGIKIAMEPNVVQKFNLIDGKNELCLFADYLEISKLYKIIKKTSLGLLLDLGHTSVTSHWLNFNKDEFVEKCKNKVFAIHASNNNGLQDQHKSLTKDCWQTSKLKEFKHVPIILETMNLSVEQIKENIKLVNDVFVE